MPLIRAERLSFAYNGGPPVLNEVSFDVEGGEFLGIAGPNGGGKTTLIRLIVGLETPTAGRLEVFGEPPGQVRRRSRIGYLPQRAELGLDAPITVRELVTAGRAAVGGVLRPLRSIDATTVEAAVERVGLVDRMDRPLHSLSGGQRQRAFIAKALACEPQLLVLDEPTAGVDPPAQDALARLLDQLRRQLNVTILYVSHEFGAIEPYVQRLLLIRARIVFDGPPSRLAERWHDPSHPHMHAHGHS